MSITGNFSCPRLISAAVLFRHGARGPGDSELSAWDDKDEIVTQWLPTEVENLSSRGIGQIVALGKWFAKKYVGLHTYSIAEPATFFRGSVSDRAVESGKDFVRSFNTTLGQELCSEETTPYLENPDNYFRPWKTHPESGKVIKDKMIHEEWNQKVEENHEFLSRLCSQARLKPEFIDHPSKVLLSSTHMAGIAECEHFWPHEQGVRDRFSSCITDPADWEKLHELSCYVWQERYLKTGIEKELGGFLLLDMIQVRCCDNIPCIVSVSLIRT
jgi:hypothetical protein